MACFPVPPLYSLPCSSSKKLVSRFFSRTDFPNSLCPQRKKRILGSLSLSVSISSTCIGKSDADTTNKTASTMRELCQARVPDHVLSRVEEVGYVVPTDVQREVLPVLFSGCDCVLHAQTGSGKTLAYLLLIFSVVNAQRSAVQALIVVPTRELGMQVTKVARMLATRSSELESEQKSCTVMALLDGGTLSRHKSWLKVEPPAIVIATLGSLCRMLDKQILKLDTLRVLVIDEVDVMFNSSKEVSSLKRLLTTYSSINNRQTIFASASIPQHRRFLYDCIQQKWTKANVSHVHVNPVEPMPSCLYHRFVICGKKERLSTLLHLLMSDAPQSAIVFVGEQSEKSKKAGNAPPTTLLIEFLKTSYGGCPEIILLEEDMNFNQRAASLTVTTFRLFNEFILCLCVERKYVNLLIFIVTLPSSSIQDVKQADGYLLIATDIAARGVDLPETTHIYNFNLPKDAINYLHRAGRTGIISDPKSFAVGKRHLNQHKNKPH